MRHKILLYTIALSIFIFGLHKSGYLVAYISQDKANAEYGGFSLFTMKGDQGYSSDLCLYATQIKQANKNFSPLFQQDPYIYENAGKSLANGNLIYFLASVFLYFLSIQNVFLFAPLVSIFLTVFLLKEILVACFGPLDFKRAFFLFINAALLVLLTYYDGKLNLGNLVNAFKGGPVLTRDLGYAGRFPHIEFSIFLLVFWLYALVRFTKSDSLRNNILLGFALAVLQYSYFYFWTSAVFFTGLYILFSFNTFRFFFRNAFSVFIIYILLTIPFWLKFITFNSSLLGEEFAFRVGKEITILPSFHSLLFLNFFLFLLADFFLVKKENYSNGNFYSRLFSSTRLQLCLFLTTLFFTNIQLLIGYTVQPYHWLTTFYYPVVCILYSVYAYRIYLNFIADLHIQKSIKMLSICFSFFLTFSAAANNYNFGRQWAKYFQYTSSEKELVDYINANIPKNSVFMSNNVSLLSILNLQTDNFSYVGNAFITLLPKDEIAGRLADGFKEIGYTETQLKQEITKGEGFVTKYINKIRNDKAIDNTASSIPDNYNIINYVFHRAYLSGEEYEYNEILDSVISQKYKNGAKKYKLDYLVLYKKFLPANMKISLYRKAVFENNEFEIYKP